MNATRLTLRHWPASLALGFAAAVLPAVPASAATATPEYNIGTFSQGDQQLMFSNAGLGSGFSDKLNFSLTTNLGVDALFTWSNTTRSTMGSFSAQLFRVGVNAGQDFLITGSVAPTGNSTSFGAQYPANLASGSYYLLTQGNGGGLNGGRYTVSLSSHLPITSSIGPAVSPVPEPHAWAMMLAGLLLMSMRVRHWKQRTAQSDGSPPEVLIRAAGAA